MFLYEKKVFDDGLVFSDMQKTGRTFFKNLFTEQVLGLGYAEKSATTGGLVFEGREFLLSDVGNFSGFDFAAADNDERLLFVFENIFLFLLKIEAEKRLGIYVEPEPVQEDAGVRSDDGN